MSNVQEREIKTRLQGQLQGRRTRVQQLRQQFENKKQAIHGVLDRERRRDAEFVKRLSEQLTRKIRQGASGVLDEKRRRTQQIKGQERLLPFKLRYFQYKKQERIKELLHKNAEEQEQQIQVRLQELAQLDVQEGRLFEQLRNLSSRHVQAGRLMHNGGSNSTKNSPVAPAAHDTAVIDLSPHQQQNNDLEQFGRNNPIFEVKPALSLLA